MNETSGDWRHRVLSGARHKIRTFFLLQNQPDERFLCGLHARLKIETRITLWKNVKTSRSVLNRDINKSFWTHPFLWYTAQESGGEWWINLRLTFDLRKTNTGGIHIPVALMHYSSVTNVPLSADDNALLVSLMRHNPWWFTWYRCEACLTNIVCVSRLK